MAIHGNSAFVSYTIKSVNDTFPQRGHQLLLVLPQGIMLLVLPQGFNLLW